MLLLNSGEITLTLKDSTVCMYVHMCLCVYVRV